MADHLDDPQTEYRRRARRDAFIIETLRAALVNAERRLRRMRRATFLACLGLGVFLTYEGGRFIAALLTFEPWRAR